MEQLAVLQDETGVSVDWMLGRKVPMMVEEREPKGELATALVRHIYADAVRRRPDHARRTVTSEMLGRTIPVMDDETNRILGLPVLADDDSIPNSVAALVLDAVCDWFSAAVSEEERKLAAARAKALEKDQERMIVEQWLLEKDEKIFKRETELEEMSHTQLLDYSKRRARFDDRRADYEKKQEDNSRRLMRAQAIASYRQPVQGTLADEAMEAILMRTAPTPRVRRLWEPGADDVVLRDFGISPRFRAHPPGTPLPLMGGALKLRLASDVRKQQK